jgi:hypothetical protein
MRYVVFVKEADATAADGSVVAYPEWLGLVEAPSVMEAVYQYPRYTTMWKQDYFLSTFKSPEQLYSQWEDLVCVRPLDEMLGELLST